MMRQKINNFMAMELITRLERNLAKAFLRKISTFNKFLLVDN